MWCLLRVTLAFTVLSVPATFAQTTGTPSTPQSFDDWKLLCQEHTPSVKAGTGDVTPESNQVSDKPTSTCQLIQTATAAKDGPTVFLLSISPSSTGKGSSAVITVPSGVYLANGIQIQVDTRRAFKVLYEVCDQTGCHAGFKLSGTVLSAFKKGTLAKVHVWTAKTKAVAFPVSLLGFTKAYQAYLEGNKS